MLRRAVWGPAVVSGALAPLAWTGAWVLAGLLQPGYDIRRDYISGLAAMTAQNPALMIGGFILGGVGTVIFAVGLFRAIGRGNGTRFGPALMALVGVGIIAAGIFRTDCSEAATVCALRDQFGLTSWHSHVHDMLANGYVLFSLPPLLLSRRFRPGAARRRLQALSIAIGAVTVVFAALFHWHALAPWSGVLQRVFITAPFVWVEAAALHLWWTGARAAVPETRPARAAPAQPATAGIPVAARGSAAQGTHG